MYNAMFLLNALISNAYKTNHDSKFKATKQIQYNIAAQINIQFYCMEFQS